MEKCSLSIAMCTFNGARFLREQLESIFAQTRQPDELVIFDDCSSDGTVEVMERFARHAPFAVRLAVNECNLGSTKNFEKAIAACRGEIIFLADQDDVWHRNKLEVVESVFIARPSVGAVFSDADVVDEHQISLGFRLWRSSGFGKAKQKGVSSGRSVRILLNHNVVTGATMAFRARFRGFVLPIPENWVHDAWIALLLSVVADLAVIEEPLIRYRRHANQQIGPVNFTFAGHLARAKTTGAHEYSALARQFNLARERLLSAGHDPRIQAVIPDFEMKIKHLKARALVDTKKLSRLPRILEELLSRRYHRFSEGWKSAAKDLLL
jgi:glycosyltransferase involved in cell wall biosynthesis